MHNPQNWVSETLDAFAWIIGALLLLLIITALIIPAIFLIAVMLISWILG